MLVGALIDRQDTESHEIRIELFVTLTEMK